MTKIDPSERMLMEVIAEHRHALEIDQRSVEFDKLIEYLDFYRKPMWEKFTIYVLKGFGLFMGLLVVLGLLIGNLFHG